MNPSINKAIHRFAKALPLAAALLPAFVLAAPDNPDEARRAIIIAYQRSIDALRRLDADTALQMDTADWVSVTTGQKPRTKREMEPFIRRDVANLRPPPGWWAIWRPDYERNGTISGIQIYDVKLDGDTATVLCLVGSSQTEKVNGLRKQSWRGSHVRDTWIKTPAGWKRRMHEKLTVNERMIDGKPVTK